MYKKSVFLFSYIFFASIAISCNNDKNNQQKVIATKETPPANKPPGHISGNLYTLYLTNAELKKLLGDVKKKKMVVFQFFHNKSDTLILDAWPRQLGPYDKHNAKALHSIPTIDTNIAGVDVHLGDLNIGRKEYKLLNNVINKKGYEYIIFIPKILVDTAIGINHVVYDIYADSSLSSYRSHQRNNKPIIYMYNPSPPRPAN
jgi:hypothetical protein